jgi:hypothetical protein
MVIAEEFLVLPRDESVRVYGVYNYPHDQFIGRDAQRLRVEGPVWVRPPRTELTAAQWERWLERLKEAGWSVALGPFWTGEPSDEFVPLEDVRDVLLRSARETVEVEDQRTAVARREDSSIDRPVDGSGGGNPSRQLLRTDAAGRIYQSDVVYFDPGPPPRACVITLALRYEVDETTLTIVDCDRLCSDGVR